MKLRDKSILFAGLSLLLCCLLAGVAGANEVDECLGCHADVDTVGEELLLDGDAFAHTIHSGLGCISCHYTVTEEHMDDGAPIASSDRLDCLDCHAEVNDQYMHTSHAENATCTDCHDPHNAHGLEKVSAETMNRQCAQCHDSSDVFETHASWLPQAELHLAELTCVACHTGADGYEVVLHISHKDPVTGGFLTSGYQDLRQFGSGNEIRSLIDLNGDDLISLAELRSFNRNPAYADLRLDGTLVPDEASHDLRAQDSRYDCSFCHAAGPESMQTSFLALPNPNGSFARVDVEKGAVLDALYGTPDFYLTGSTRNASLNMIGFIVICGGFIMPIGHGTLRFLTRKNRKH